jgi:hypothetical protein
MKLASVSSVVQGGGKRRAEGMGVAGHDGKLTHPVCGVVNGVSGFAVCAASVMSVPPWPSAVWRTADPRPRRLGRVDKAIDARIAN